MHLYMSRFGANGNSPVCAQVACVVHQCVDQCLPQCVSYMFLNFCINCTSMCQLYVPECVHQYVSLEGCENPAVACRGCALPNAMCGCSAHQMHSTHGVCNGASVHGPAGVAGGDRGSGQSAWHGAGRVHQRKHAPRRRVRGVDDGHVARARDNRARHRTCTAMRGQCPPVDARTCFESPSCGLAGLAACRH